MDQINNKDPKSIQKLKDIKNGKIRPMSPLEYDFRGRRVIRRKDYSR